MKKTAPLLTFGFCLFVLIGCEVKQPVETLTEADQKFISIVQEEAELDVIIKAHPHTTWMYIPVQFDFFAIKLDNKSAETSSEAQISKTMRFVDVAHVDDNFNVAYDVGENKIYMKTHGFNNSYTEEYLTKQRTVFSAITRSYADLTEDIPDFFVIVFANIELGLEIRILIHSGDLIRANTDHSFNEELMKRMIQEPPVGSKYIVGDTEGKHLKDYDITWPEFLARQIKYRIEFKYGRSIFPPSEHTREEILNIISNVSQFYEFYDFKAIILRDLNLETEETISQEQMKSEIDKKEITGGKLHVINFDGMKNR